MAPESAPNARRAAFTALKAELSGAARGGVRPALEDLISTAVPELDRVLGGGFPRGLLATLEGSAGRWSIAARLAALVTQRALAAVIDDGGLYPPDLARAGARLDRVPIVPARTPLGIARAADLLLRSRACRLIVMPAAPLRPAVWNRLATLAHRTSTLLVVVLGAADRAGAHGPLVAAAGLRLHCTRERLIVAGSRGLWCSFAGYDVRAEVRKHKSSTLGASARVRAVDPLDGVALRERPVPHREGLLHVALR